MPPLRVSNPVGSCRVVSFGAGLKLEGLLSRWIGCIDHAEG